MYLLMSQRDLYHFACVMLAIRPREAHEFGVSPTCRHYGGSHGLFFFPQPPLTVTVFSHVFQQEHAMNEKNPTNIFEYAV